MTWTDLPFLILSNHSVSSASLNFPSLKLPPPLFPLCLASALRSAWNVLSFFPWWTLNHFKNQFQYYHLSSASPTQPTFPDCTVELIPTRCFSSPQFFIHLFINRLKSFLCLGFHWWECCYLFEILISARQSSHHSHPEFHSQGYLETLNLLASVTRQMDPYVNLLFYSFQWYELGFYAIHQVPLFLTRKQWSTDLKMWLTPWVQIPLLPLFGCVTLGDHTKMS